MPLYKKKEKKVPTQFLFYPFRTVFKRRSVIFLGQFEVRLDKTGATSHYCEILKLPMNSAAQIPPPTLKKS